MKQADNYYATADHINMEFNSKKFEWIRYTAGSGDPPDF